MEYDKKKCKKTKKIKMKYDQNYSKRKTPEKIKMEDN